MVVSIENMNEIPESELNKVPDDFPRPMHMGAVGGAQPKLLAVSYKGKFYEPGATPPDLYKRWSICANIVEQLAAKSLQSKLGKRSHMSEAEILEQYFNRLLATKWTSEVEARWIMRKVALTLNWEISLKDKIDAESSQKI